MPHKRQKFADRQAGRTKSGNDHAPQRGGNDISKEVLPKGKMNILNALSIRSAYHERRQKEAEPLGKKAKAKAKAAQAVDVKGKGKAQPTEAEEQQDPTKLRIRSGEKMGEFNARVEQAFAPLMSKATKAASRHAQNQKKRKRGRGGEEDEEQSTERRKENARAAEAREKAEKLELKAERQRLGGEKEFATVSQTRDIRDVVQAPPTLKMGRLAKGAGSATKAGQRFVQSQEDAKSAAQQRIMDEERERAIAAYRQKKDKELRARFQQQF